MTERKVVISDTQVPFDDRQLLKAVVRFIGEFQPAEVVHIGDLMDFPQPSRWSKGTREEFEGNIFEDCEQAKRRLLEPLREVFSGRVLVHKGNHDARPDEYLSKYAPALASSGVFDFGVLLDFDGFGIELAPDFYDIAPGWVSTHGHRGGISLSRIAGNTAVNAAKKFGRSVVMGHTHRLGIVSHTTGYDGEGDVLTGMEVGNMMDMRMATYLKGSTANWQQGFGILTIDGDHVRPEVISVSDRRFVVDGEVYKF